MAQVAWHPASSVLAFPPAEQALRVPDGLLMVGGDLSEVSLKNAYTNGIFPWYSENEPLMWWSPSRRAVLETATMPISKNMAKLIRQKRYQLSFDTDFQAVLHACATVGGRDKSTWITAEMQAAYSLLYQQGLAHCVAVYDNDKQLVGGLYGVFIKNIFCGESMFSQAANTSKLALISLANFLSAHGCAWIDCQIPTPHLSALGAKTLIRSDFLFRLETMQENKRLVSRQWSDLWQHFSA